MRLLRVLQEGASERVGGERAVHVSVRIAAALLGIDPHTLRARMRKPGIDWARYR